MPARPAPRVHRAFTVVELLVVVVLLGTWFAIALPRLNSTTRQHRVISSARALSADVPVAFSLAARQRKPVVMSWDASSGEVRFTDRTSGAIYLRRPLKATSEYQLDSVAMTPASVQLFPTGVSSASVTFHLGSGTHVRHVTVGRTGLTRVFRP